MRPKKEDDLNFSYYDISHLPPRSPADIYIDETDKDSSPP